MPDNPTRPVALVTGAARRIGAAIALELGRAGYAVAIHFCSSKADAEALAQEVRAFGGASMALNADLRDASAINCLIERCCATLGAPTCLVNNAAEFNFDSLNCLTADSWNRHIDLNLRAPVLLAQAFARALPRQGTGNIINIVDQRAWKPTPTYFSYTLSKSALWLATQMLAQALAPRIRVNAIGPGPVLKNVHQTDAEFEIERTSTLLRRGTSPREIASAVRFILDAPAMTGQMIALDGGQHLTWEFEQHPADGAQRAAPVVGKSPDNGGT